MSGIGGYYDALGESADSLTLRSASRALTLRGRDRADAALFSGAAILCNSRTSGSKTGGRMPFCFDELTVAVDGAEWESRERCEHLVESYRERGLACIGEMTGHFALALYDAKKKCLLLARDASGGAPLYLTMEGKRCLFSSRIGGLRALMRQESGIDLDALERHIIASPYGRAACRLYRNVGEVLPGECIFLSEAGVQRFPDLCGFFMEPLVIGEVRQVPAANPSAGLFELLRDALYAFEYPQFDAWMPSYAALLRALGAEGVERAWVEDAVRYADLSYAYEREARLGAWYGVESVGVAPERMRREHENFSRLEEALTRMLWEEEERDDILIRLFGEAFLESVARQRGRTCRIRMLGMLLQTRIWFCESGCSFFSEKRDEIF